MYIYYCLSLEIRELCAINITKYSEISSKIIIIIKIIIKKDHEHVNVISSQSEPLRSTKLPQALKALHSHNKPGLKE